MVPLAEDPTIRSSRQARDVSSCKERKPELGKKKSPSHGGKRSYVGEKIPGQPEQGRACVERLRDRLSKMLTADKKTGSLRKGSEEKGSASQPRRNERQRAKEEDTREAGSEFGRDQARNRRKPHRENPNVQTGDGGPVKTRGRDLRAQVK